MLASLRWTCRCLAALIGGCILAMLVAWACLCWGPEYSRVRQAAAPAGLDLPANDTPIATQLWGLTQGFGWVEAYADGTRFADGQVFYPNRPAYCGKPIIRRAGWPVHVLVSRVEAVECHGGVAWPQRWQLPPDEIVRRGYPINDLPQWFHARLDSRLPLIPLWPNIALGGVLYTPLAVLSYLLARGMLRKLRRLIPRRPLGYPACTACGYNLTGLPPHHRCPECGTAYGE